MLPAEVRPMMSMTTGTDDKRLYCPEAAAFLARWPILATCWEAGAWLQLQRDVQLAPRTLDAYARRLADYLGVCRREGIDPLEANRSDVARYVRDLVQRPNPR